jgi:hypothetical protein
MSEKGANSPVFPLWWSAFLFPLCGGQGGGSYDGWWSGGRGRRSGLHNDRPPDSVPDPLLHSLSSSTKTRSV